MAFLDTHERAQLQAISDVTYCNPFLPEYPERQRLVLGDDFLESQALHQCSLTADELLRHYCTLVFTQTGSYAETARRLNLDRRTVKSKVDPTLVC